MLGIDPAVRRAGLKPLLPSRTHGAPRVPPRFFAMIVLNMREAGG